MVRGQNVEVVLSSWVWIKQTLPMVRGLGWGYHTPAFREAWYEGQEG